MPRQIPLELLIPRKLSDEDIHEAVKTGQRNGLLAERAYLKICLKTKYPNISDSELEKGYEERGLSDSQIESRMKELDRIHASRKKDLQSKLG